MVLEEKIEEDVWVEDEGWFGWGFEGVREWVWA